MSLLSTECDNEKGAGTCRHEDVAESGVQYMIPPHLVDVLVTNTNFNVQIYAVVFMHSRILGKPPHGHQIVCIWGICRNNEKIIQITPKVLIVTFFIIPNNIWAILRLKLSTYKKIKIKNFSLFRLYNSNPLLESDLNYLLNYDPFAILYHFQAT